LYGHKRGHALSCVAFPRRERTQPPRSTGASQPTAITSPHCLSTLNTHLSTVNTHLSTV
jgi:hypothetical protein